MQSEWNLVPLSEVAELRGGNAFKSKDYSTQGKFILRTLNISDEGRISQDDAVYLPESLWNEYSRFELQANDTLFVMVGATLGKVGFVREHDLPALLNQNMWLIRAIPALADSTYIQYAFRHTVKSSLQFASGSARDFVRRDDYRRMKIPVPPLLEQKAIAQILRSLDDKIELNRRTNATLESLAQTLFRAWFVDFEPVKAKAAGLQPAAMDAETAALFPPEWESSTRGLIPKGWKIKQVSEVAEINGWTLGKSDDIQSIRYIEISEVTRGDIRSITEYSIKDAPSRARRRLRHGDTVLSTVRPDRGAYFLSLHPSKDLIASTGFAVVTPTSAPWSVIHAALTQNEMSDYLGNLADGGAYPAVRPDVISKWNLVLPSGALLEKFHELCAPLYEKIEMNRSESQTLSQLRDALLPRLISGQLRVPEAMRAVEAAL